MAADRRTPEQIRHEIANERHELSVALEALRTEFGKATDVAARLRGRLPLAAAGAAAAGFVVAGGLGATMRLLARRGREGNRLAKLGRFSVAKR